MFNNLLHEILPAQRYNDECALNLSIVQLHKTVKQITERSAGMFHSGDGSALVCE